MATALRINSETGQQELVEIADQAPIVPEAVTPSQAKIALSRAGKLVQAEAIINALEGQAGEEARIYWVSVLEFRRDHPLIAMIGAALGMTEGEIDALFIAAASI